MKTKVFGVLFKVALLLRPPYTPKKFLGAAILVAGALGWTNLSMYLTCVVEKPHTYLEECSYLQLQNTFSFDR